MTFITGRLRAMMFLQYFIWGAWAVPAGGYLTENLQYAGSQIAWIYLTTAIGAMIAPLFIGYIADRYFATEKMLAVLHGVGAILLASAAMVTDFTPLFLIMLGYSFCYMPTLALSNSISLRNIKDPDAEFPWIRVMGTIGWIASGLAYSFLIGEGNEYFFYLAAGGSGVLAIFSLLLPHTPPETNEENVGSVFGLDALSLLAERSFAVFTLACFVICIPLAFYYNFANAFLKELQIESATALMTLGQWSEIGFMLAMPWFIIRLGAKKMLALGMLAWLLRYGCFAGSDLPFAAEGTGKYVFIVLGLILHGICYDFFFVASQLYVDRKAPEHLRASAQSFIAFVTLGLGMAVGTLVSGRIVDAYPGATADAPHDWVSIWLWPAGMALVTLILFWIGFHDKVASQKVEELPDPVLENPDPQAPPSN
ncbi:Major facilitator transporter [Planctomycetales bacterium 10988]|nr:Major facilitator transporter [Planctomycetales bacterium 10988]